MALSLRDKLKAMDTTPKRPAATAMGGVEVREEVFPLSLFPYLDGLCVETLSAMCQKDLPERIDRGRVLYLDTETTGLSTGAGTVAFLVGLGFVRSDGFHVRQYLMRDYPAEGQMLCAIDALLAEFDIFVTFNGLSFDLPLLRTRWLMNRMAAQGLEKPHIDLVHIARRVFKRRLKRCRLADMEEALFHEKRENDLPGALVPERYFSYLKTGDFDLLTDVLSHNVKDIVSLCRLLCHVGSMYDHPEQISFLEDAFSIGYAYERQRRHGDARRFYTLCAAGPMAASSRERMALIYRREHDVHSATAIYLRMIQEAQGGVMPHVELAKLYEHRLHDIAAALWHTERALSLLPESLIPLDGAVQYTQTALQYRHMRLMRKSAGMKEKKDP